MSADQTRDVSRTFDDWAETGRGEGMEEGHRQTAGHLLDQLTVEPGDRFLDLGTGIGWAARDMATRGAKAVGIDVAPRMLARARRASGPRVEYALASFEALPFEDQTFDLAFSMEALYYAGDLGQALVEVARVMAPDGRIEILIDYYKENTASHGWPELTGVQMHLLSEAGWLQALVDAGFGQASSRRLTAPADDDSVEAWKREQGTLHITAFEPG